MTAPYANSTPPSARPRSRTARAAARCRSRIALLAVCLAASAAANIQASDGPAAPLLIAHRGASHDAPENTLAAFRLAWQQNADGIEADFFLTRDGQIVCTHDENTKRTTGVERKVAESTLHELKQLDVGSWKSKDWAGERMPTIQEVMATIPDGKKFYVEIKCGPEIVPVLKRALADSPLNTRQIVVISFREPVIAAVKKELAGVKAIWLVDYYQDEQTGAWRPDLPDILRRLRGCRADGLGTQANRHVVDAAFVAELRRAGFEFHTWTINDPARADYFRSLGVDSITTDRPKFLRQHWKASGN